MNYLIQMTENDKRLIICFLLLFILVFVLAGFIGILVKKIMRFQGQRGPHLIRDVAAAGIYPNERKLRHYGYRKNIRYFVKHSWIPMLIILVGVLTYFISSAFYGHLINLHDYGSVTNETGYVVDGGEGWTTLFFIWDFAHPMHGEFFGMNLISGFPKLANPHFEAQAIPAYIFFFTMIVGGTWWFVCVQAYIARAYTIWKESRRIFMKTTEDLNGNNVSNPQANKPIENQDDLSE